MDGGLDLRRQPGGPAPGSHRPQPAAEQCGPQHAYTTSPEHRILGLIESTGATATWGYTYDQADRLTQALSSLVGPYGYELDAGDNLLSIQTPPGIATSTYNGLNQIDLRDGQPFTYDAAGNLLDDGQRSYEWDAAQRLVRIRYPGSTRSTEFRYDGLGRRSAILEWHNNNNYTETRYLWCGERICQARSGSDTVIRRYYDEGELGPNAYYYAQDHLGSVRDLVNASGQVLASYDYDPYGNPTRTEESGSARADYRYAGLFYHAPSGLYLTHYRVYDPVTARWLSRDPIEEMGGVNLYGYVFQNPINFYDPLGLRCWTNELGQSVCDSGSPFPDTYCPGGDCAAFPASMNDHSDRECVEKCRKEKIWIDVLCDYVGGGVGDAVVKSGRASQLVGFSVGQAVSGACGKFVEILICECDEESNSCPAK
ncbi:MAG: RHS repeat domain-containing protein [Pseudomonadota bacterium]